MPYRHACFLSYRHAQSEILVRFVQDLEAALTDELALVSELPVYTDTKRLQGGDFFNEGIARALCESVCMVVVFVPEYFHPDHPYCTREYLAMKHLETVRLQPGAQHGLIIPVVLRGFDYLPEEVKGLRQVHDFSSFRLSDPSRRKNRALQDLAHKISEYVRDRSHELSAAAHDCTDFQLPEPEVAVRAARQLRVRRYFPGRNC